MVAPGFPRFADGRVTINPDQGFDAVPAIAWGFHIGGYQPAQKWLKDRRGRVLSYDDIGHYQKIVKILTETDRIMGEIDLPLDGLCCKTDVGDSRRESSGIDGHDAQTCRTCVSHDELA